ncbi:hypothetical protein GVAV_001380 [Gurleya vavrai]
MMKSKFINAQSQTNDVARLFEETDDILIDFCDDLVSSKDTDPGVITSKEENSYTKWKFKAEKNGYQIMNGNKCLTKMEAYDNVLRGYYLNMQPCDSYETNVFSLLNAGHIKNFCGRDLEENCCGMLENILGPGCDLPYDQERDPRDRREYDDRREDDYRRPNDDERPYDRRKKNDYDRPNNRPDNRPNNRPNDRRDYKKPYDRRDPDSEYFEDRRSPRNENSPRNDPYRKYPSDRPRNSRRHPVVDDEGNELPDDYAYPEEYPKDSNRPKSRKRKYHDEESTPTYYGRTLHGNENEHDYHHH